MKNSQGYRDVYVTSKTKRGIPAIRVPADGSDRTPRVKGDTYDPQSEYYRGK